MILLGLLFSRPGYTPPVSSIYYVYYTNILYFVKWVTLIHGSCLSGTEIQEAQRTRILTKSGMFSGILSLLSGNKPRAERKLKAFSHLGQDKISGVF